MATTINTRSKPLVKDLHEHFVCPLCRGYLIDATTLVECLHSFCRGCIVRRLGSGARACPVCGALTLPPLLPDLALQRLVYLAVPGLYRSELDRRRHFRLVNPQCQPPSPPLGALALTLEDAVSLSLCEILTDDNQRADREIIVATEKTKDDDDNNENSNTRQIRYLKCPAGVTVRHLVRLLALKRGWGDNEAGKLTLNRIEMLYENSKDDDGKTDLRPLQLSWTLLDLACIFKWDKETPMKLYYRVVKREEPIPQPRAITSISSCNNIVIAGSGCGNSNNSAIFENVQRPPTPPPSPKQSTNNTDMRTVAQQQQQQQQNRSNDDKNSYNKTKSNTDNPKSQLPEPTKITAEMETREPGFSGNNAEQLLVNSTETTSKTTTVNNCLPINPEIATCAEFRHGIKIKKPRCEVTPVMRTAPGGPQGSCGSSLGVADNNNKTNKVSRMEHHKRRKRRNKRLIAEITTTPREDLLKLKVRLTPCPPRITSSTGSAKEKLLQMRAVRREKIKNNPERNETPPSAAGALPATSVQQITIDIGNQEIMPLTPPPSAAISMDNTKSSLQPTAVTQVAKLNIETVGMATKQKIKENVIVLTEKEETIEEIINGIPDEVVRVAQNLNNSNNSSASTTKEDNKMMANGNTSRITDSKRKKDQKVKDVTKLPEVEIIRVSSRGTRDEEVAEDEEEEFYEEDEDDEEELENDVAGEKLTALKPKKDAEVLRRLGLVAISETSKTIRDKINDSKISSENENGSGMIDYHRESLERQLRESKANRVRSLLAEKQMRDTLKSMLSKSNGQKKGSINAPKKGPPPLAPLTLKQVFSNHPKSCGSRPTTNHPQISSRDTGITGKNEIPLDLSSGAHNALDLSPTPSSSSSGSSNPVITSTTFSSPIKSKTTNTTGSVSPGTTVAPVAVAGGSTTGGGPGSTGTVHGGQVKPSQDKKNQDLNLRTLSDAAVSLLSTNPSAAAAAAAAAAVAAAEVRITNSTILSNKVALRIPQPHQRLSGFGNGMKIKPNLAVRHIPNPQAFVASQYRNQRNNFFNAQQQPP